MSYSESQVVNVGDINSRWDHSTKPSTFIVTEDGKEIFRGPFTEGYELYRKKRCLMFENCRISQATLEVQNKI